MLYVAFARRVKRLTRGGDQKLLFIAPSVITVVSNCQFANFTLSIFLVLCIKGPN